VQEVYSWYHHPDYFWPEPYAAYPSHMHIDLLERAQGRGYGRLMLEEVMARLRQRGSPGAHVGVSASNESAVGFYKRLGFRELVRHDNVIHMGKGLR
jgi:ribosomal protein S18 acetylase RimI-like enzyme